MGWGWAQTRTSILHTLILVFCKAVGFIYPFSFLTSASGSHLPLHPQPTPCLRPLGSPKTAPFCPSSRGCFGNVWHNPWQGSEEENLHLGLTWMKSARATGVGRPSVPELPPVLRVGPLQQSGTERAGHLLGQELFPRTGLGAENHSTLVPLRVCFGCLQDLQGADMAVSPETSPHLLPVLL